MSNARMPPRCVCMRAAGPRSAAAPPPLSSLPPVLSPSSGPVGVYEAACMTSTSSWSWCGRLLVTRPMPGLERRRSRRLAHPCGWRGWPMPGLERRRSRRLGHPCGWRGWPMCSSTSLAPRHV
eukprot:350065-Chlamydomonas_euryale.AAC.9